MSNSLSELGLRVLGSEADEVLRPGDCRVTVRGGRAGIAPWRSAPHLPGREGSCPPPQVFSGRGRNRTCVGERKENRTETRDF